MPPGNCSRSVQRPQCRHQLRGRRESQREYLFGDDRVTGHLAATRENLHSLGLGVGVRHDFDDAVVFHRCEALLAQSGKQDRVNQVACHRLVGNDIDRALDLWVDDEILARDDTDRLDRRFNVQQN